MRAAGRDVAHNGDVMTWWRGYREVCRRAENTLISDWLHSHQVTTVEPQVVDHKVILLKPGQSQIARNTLVKMEILNNYKLV